MAATGRIRTPDSPDSTPQRRRLGLADLMMGLGILAVLGLIAEAVDVVTDAVTRPFGM